MPTLGAIALRAQFQACNNATLERRFRRECGRARGRRRTCEHLDFNGLRICPRSATESMFERSRLPKHVVHLGHFRHVPLRDVTVKRYRTIENAEGKNKTSVGVMAGLKPR